MKSGKKKKMIINNQRKVSFDEEDECSSDHSIDSEDLEEEPGTSTSGDEDEEANTTSSSSDDDDDDDEENDGKRKLDDDEGGDIDDKNKNKPRVKKIPKGDWSQCLEDIWSIEKPRYKTGETKEKIDELTKKITLISDDMEKKMPTLRKIIEATDMDERTKEELIPLYILHENAGFCIEKSELREKIIEKFNAKKMSGKTLALKNRLYADPSSSCSSSSEMEERILELELPEDQIRIIHQKYLSYINMSSEDGNVKAKTKEWLDYAMRLPTKIKPLAVAGAGNNKEATLPGLAPLPEVINIKKCLQDIQKILDSSLYGMKKEKEELLIVINTMLSNPKCSNLSLGFVGEAGMGKTELVRSLAKALDIPFTHISMGGCHDASFLTGHNIVYEGAQPGAIVKALCRTGYKNGIIYFDEIDKLEETTRGKGVMSTLLHILDPAQNKIFQDNFLDELPIDISQIWMMYSLNDVKKLEKPLLDRMKIIPVGSHNKMDKFNILKFFSIPKILINLGLNVNASTSSSQAATDTSHPSQAVADIIFLDESIKHLISVCGEGGRFSANNNSSGIRGLNQTVGEILSRVSILKNTRGVVVAATPSTPLKDKNADESDKKGEEKGKKEEKEKNEDDDRLLNFSFNIPNISFPLIITPDLVDKFLSSTTSSLSAAYGDRGYNTHMSMIA
jgi:hypothetical protein